MNDAVTDVRLAVLLRAVNVGGKRKLAMPALRAALAEAGCTGVSTLLNSGNVVVDDRWGDAASAVRELSDTISAVAGFDVPLVVRTGAELAQVVATDPYADHREEGSHHQVMFLADTPSATARAAVAAVDPSAWGPETFTLLGRELHLWLPNGSGRSKLAAFAWERTTGVAGTARNWNTVLKLADLSA